MLFLISIVPFISRLITGSAEPTKCPNGTFRGQTLGKSVQECQDCTAGWFCNITGLVKPADQCSPGYYCPPKSVSPTENVCPEGHYCPIMTEHPKECPEGTFSNTTRLEQENDCPKCLQGYYCDTTKLTYPTGLCKAGYYCPLGSVRDTQEPCPSAMYCPQGSYKPEHCPAGSYTEVGSSAVCEECPPGYYCVPNTVTPGKCFSFCSSLYLNMLL